MPCFWSLSNKDDTGDLFLEWVVISSESLDLFWPHQQMSQLVVRSWSEGCAWEWGIPLSFLPLFAPQSSVKGSCHIATSVCWLRLCTEGAPRGNPSHGQSLYFPLSILNTIWKQHSGCIVVQTVRLLGEERSHGIADQDPPFLALLLLEKVTHPLPLGEKVWFDVTTWLPSNVLVLSACLSPPAWGTCVLLKW